MNKALKVAIKGILIEHEKHQPIYTCRLQIADAIMQLITAREDRLVERIKGLSSHEARLKRGLDEFHMVTYDEALDDAIQLIREEKIVSVNGGTCFKCGTKNINIVGFNIHHCDKPSSREERDWEDGFKAGFKSCEEAIRENKHSHCCFRKVLKPALHSQLQEVRGKIKRTGPSTHKVFDDKETTSYREGLIDMKKVILHALDEMEKK